MMIVDFSQLFMCCLFGSVKNSGVNEDVITHSFFSRLFEYKQLFPEYGKVVVAFDGKKLWRKDVFPNYKANRAEARAKQDIDWSAVFSVLNTMKNDIKTKLPVCSVEVDEAEADDVVAVMSSSFHMKENIMIISSDKDFIQLQCLDGVKQYSPTSNSLVYSDDPSRDIKIKLLKGDSNDGVPNIFSDDDALVKKQRQKPIYESKIDDYYLTIEEGKDESIVKNFKRNKTLIDFKCIPKHVKIKILEGYLSAMEDLSSSAQNRSTEQYLKSKNLFLLMPFSDILEN